MDGDFWLFYTECHSGSQVSGAASATQMQTNVLSLPDSGRSVREDRAGKRARYGAGGGGVDTVPVGSELLRRLPCPRTQGLLMLFL